MFFFTIMKEDVLRKQNSTKSQNRPVGEKTVFLPVVSRLKLAKYKPQWLLCRWHTTFGTHINHAKTQKKSSKTMVKSLQEVGHFDLNF